MTEIDISTKPWFDYLGEDLQELLNESLHLLKSVNQWDEKFHDYSFVVFPASKAFEGFLKKLFLDMDFITNEQYYYKYFRIGKALNPELERKYRQKDSIYDKLVHYCGGPDLANLLWATWKKCRNGLFHWFPDERTVISFQEAHDYINQVIAAIDQSVESCKINYAPEGKGV